MAATYERFTNPETGEIEAKITPAVSPEDEAAAADEARNAELRAKILTVAEIEAAEDILEAVVPVPEWGGSVRVRQFSKDTEFKLRKAARIGGEIDRERLEMLVLIHGIVEPEVTEEHIGLLQGKGQKAVDRVLTKITAMNAVTKEAADEAVRQFREGR